MRYFTLIFDFSQGEQGAPGRPGEKGPSGPIVSLSTIKTSLALVMDNAYTLTPIINP